MLGSWTRSRWSRHAHQLSIRHTASAQVRASEALVSQHWETRLPTAPASSKAPSKPSTRSTATTAIEIPDDIESPARPPAWRARPFRGRKAVPTAQNQERPSWRLPAPLAGPSTKKRRRAIAGAVAPTGALLLPSENHEDRRRLREERRFTEASIDGMVREASVRCEWSRA